MTPGKEAEMGRLLPCPFCGSLAGLHEQRNVFPEGAGWRVECEGACRAMTCYWHSTTDATAYWNKRALSLESVREEALDAKMAELLIDTTWRKCVGQCTANNCGRLFISRERFDEHIAPLIRAQHAPARVAEGRLALLEKAYWIATGLNPAQDLEEVSMSRPLTDEEIIEQAKLTASIIQERTKPAPESPAKEQPGEQNAAPRLFNMGQYD